MRQQVDEPRRYRLFSAFPRKPGAHIDRLRRRLLGRRPREQHRTVEPGREQHSRLHRSDAPSFDAIRSSKIDSAMYLVTKRIEFCYGHRLLDYDGVCKHPHGHNAVVEVDVRTDGLDNRNMVVDFSDIKRIVKGWIDRELDHKMILRRDDPLVGPLRALGEPMYLLESNPTIERIARLIFEKSRELGIPIVNIRVWETPSSFAAYSED